MRRFSRYNSRSCGCSDLMCPSNQLPRPEAKFYALNTKLNQGSTRVGRCSNQAVTLSGGHCEKYSVWLRCCLCSSWSSTYLEGIPLGFIKLNRSKIKLWNCKILISYGPRVWFAQFHVLSLQDTDFQAPLSQIILTYVCNVLQNAASDLIIVHSAAMTVSRIIDLNCCHLK